MVEVNRTEAQQWLADYVASGSEAAFRKLVEAHVDLVYSTALRLAVGDAALAEDVTQQVFVDLARKAGWVPKDAPLGGWLHRHAWCVAANTIRRERRRKLREEQSVVFSEPRVASEDRFEELAPLLDEAINQLGATDRAVIMERFFEGRDFRAVGEAVGTSENAARMRVARALEKLHGILKRRGVAFSAAALAAGLAGQAVTAAPAGMAARAASTALAQGAVGMAALTKLLGVLTMTKLKAGLIGSLAVLGVGASLLLQEQRQSRLREANETLRQRLDLLTAENDGLSNRLASATSELSRSGVEKLELMKLRSEVGELRRKYLEQQRLLAKEKEAQRKEAVESAAVPKRLTRDQWAFAGYQTPANALESMMWAMKNGDLGAFLSSMTPEAQAAVTKHFEGMTDADISAALQKESAGLPELQFDRIKTDSDTEAIYVLSTQDTDNGAQRTHDEAVIRLRNIGGEWKSGEGL